MIDLRDLPSTQLSEVAFRADHLDVERVVRCYRDVGFVVVRGLLSVYMERMRAEIASAVATARDELATATLMPYGWMTRNGGIFKERSSAGDGDPGVRDMIVAPLSATSSATMDACFRDARLRQILDRLLDRDVNMTGAGQCMYKEALHGNPAWFHQDDSYPQPVGPGGAEFRDVVTVFAYVVPTPIERGCIWVVPFSHRLGLVPHDKTGRYQGCIPEGVCDWSHAIAIPGAPGDTVLWSGAAIHGSQANVTPEPRPAVVMRYARLAPPGQASVAGGP